MEEINVNGAVRKYSKGNSSDRNHELLCWWDYEHPEMKSVKAVAVFRVDRVEYEVHLMRIKNGRKVFDKEYPTCWQYAGDEDFGTYGFSCASMSTLLDIVKRYGGEEIVSGMLVEGH